MLESETKTPLPVITNVVPVPLWTPSIIIGLAPLVSET